MADAYVEEITSAAADREAQAVLRRMIAEGSSLDAAMDAHIQRYHSSRPEAEVAEIRQSIASQLEDILTIRELVLEFEGYAISIEATSGVLEANWRQINRWDAPHPIEHYTALLADIAHAYMASGLDEGQAAIRAAVEMQAARDRDRGVLPSQIVDRNDGCFEERVMTFDTWLRNTIMMQQNPMTEEEISFVTEHTNLDPERMSRLSYFTMVGFGPRLYSYDRFDAWRLAAERSGH